jgi:spore maturation protein SpmB
MWRLWAKSLGEKVGKNNKEADKIALIRTILFATYCSTITGLILVSIKQKLNLFNPVVFAYIGGMSALIFGLLTWCIYHPESITTVSDFVGNFVLFGTIVSFIVLGAIRKVNIYESFVEGAKGGFEIAIGILPFVIAILAAVSVFRSSGAMQALFDGIGFTLTSIGVTSLAFIDALPVAFMKPFSGPGARAMMLEVFQSKGVDSFAGKLASTFQGCTDTTFYILAVYFGSVGITKIRYAAKMGLMADFVGIMASIFLAYLFYK